MVNLTSKDFINKDKFSTQELSYVKEALSKEHWGRDWNSEVENKFSKIFGVNHSITCNSGTSGLHAALAAIDIKEGDEVITPALTVVMDAYTVIYKKAIPTFSDVDLSTHLVTAEEIEKKITPKTKAIITVSWNGLSCDMDPIMKLAKKHNLKVIDDSAQSVLAKYNGKMAGTIADIGVFSFESRKHITSGGEGGMIVTNDKELATKARKFAGIGYRHLSASAGKTHLASSTVQDPTYRRFDTLGYNYRMNPITASVLMGQLDRIDEIVNKRKYIGKMFLDATSGYDWFIPQYTPSNCEHSYYTFSVDYYENEIKFKWKEFYNKYIEMGGDGFYSSPVMPYIEPSLHKKSFGNTVLDYGLCPIAEGLQKRDMLFKTNYRDVLEAEKKVDILSKLLKSL